MGCGSSQEMKKIEVEDSSTASSASKPATNAPEPATSAPTPAANAPTPATSAPTPAANAPAPVTSAPAPAANAPAPAPAPAEESARKPPPYYPPGMVTGKIMIQERFGTPGIAANVPCINRDFGGTIIPVKLRKNPKLGVTIVDSPEGQTAHFHETRTVFLDKCISGGIYNWTIKINYLPNGINTFWFGACPSSSVEAAEGTLLSWTAGCPCVGFGSLSPDNTHTYACPYVTSGDYSNLDDTIAVPDGSYVSMELINRWQGMWFWVNGKQVPHIIRSWNVPVHIGVTGFAGTSITSIALRKLTDNTPLGCNVWSHDIQIAPKPALSATIPAPLRPDSLDASVVTLEKTPEGEKCVFTGVKTVFLDVKITEGVFSWKNLFKFNGEKKTTFYIGCALPDALGKFKPVNVSIGKLPGTCSFSFGGMHHNDDVDGYFFAPYLGSDLPAGVDDEVLLFAERTVTVEINADKHTLMFFIQDGQVPHLIENVPTPLYLGVTGDEGTSFTSLTFSRLTEPTAPILNTKVWTFKA